MEIESACIEKNYEHAVEFLQSMRPGWNRLRFSREIEFVRGMLPSKLKVGGPRGSFCRRFVTVNNSRQTINWREPRNRLPTTFSTPSTRQTFKIGAMLFAHFSTWVFTQLFYLLRGPSSFLNSFRTFFKNKNPFSISLIWFFYP